MFMYGGTVNMKAGVNLIQGYSFSNEESLHRDFALFQQHGIDLIYVNPKWTSIEPSQGNYNTSYLDRIKRVCQIAEEYGIEVCIAFMTNTRSTGATIPSWVSPKRYDTVIKNSNVADAWIDMLRYVASYLSDCINIQAYLPLDEPYFGSWAMRLSCIHH